MGQHEGNIMMKTQQLLAMTLLAGVLAACGQRSQPAPEPGAAAPGGQSPAAETAAAAPSPEATLPPMEPDNATSRDFGEHILYFNALRTSELTPEVAKTYGIVRSPNRVMLNVSLVKKVPGTPGEPVAGAVNAQAVNLNGQFKNLTIREIREGSAVYYIGDVPVSDDETLVFTVDAVPAGDTPRLSLRFSRQFR